MYSECVSREYGTIVQKNFYQNDWELFVEELSKGEPVINR